MLAPLLRDLLPPFLTWLPACVVQHAVFKSTVLLCFCARGGRAPAPSHFPRLKQPVLSGGGSVYAFATLCRAARTSPLSLFRAIPFHTACIATLPQHQSSNPVRSHLRAPDSRRTLHPSSSRDLGVTQRQGESRTQGVRGHSICRPIVHHLTFVVALWSTSTPLHQATHRGGQGT